MKNRSLKWAILAALAANLTVQTAQAAPQGSIEERLQRLERMADNPVLLRLTQRLEQQQPQIEELQDKMDRLQRDQQRFMQQAAERYAETDQRISVLEQQTKTQQATPALAPQAALPAVSAATVATPVAMQQAAQPAQPVSKIIKTRAATAEENTQYQNAFALMRAAKYEESIAAFEAFVENHADSSLASNASYWAGEGYLIRKDNQKALQAFERVLEQYPDSTKVPDAMLRAADSLQNMQKTTEAQARYRKVVETYPETRAAQSAQKRLGNQ